MQLQFSRHAAFSLFSSYHLHTVLEFKSLLRAMRKALTSRHISRAGLSSSGLPKQEHLLWGSASVICSSHFNSDPVNKRRGPTPRPASRLQLRLFQPQKPSRASRLGIGKSDGGPA